MQRRDLLKGALFAGLSPGFRTGIGSGRLEPDPVQAEAVVVEGLVAGGLRESHLKGARAGGVDVWVGGGPGDLTGYAAVLRFYDAHRADIVPARSVADILHAKREGKIASVLNWQSADALGEAFNATLGTTHTPLRAFQEIGLRVVGLCYNVTNEFGGGCLEPEVPLTRAGRRLVEEIHALRIVLDVGGHTGERTSLDAIELSRGVPVVCTHTNVAAIADNPRCISDRLIEAIAGTGGVVGITAVNDFHVRGRKDADQPHSPRVSLDRHIEQFEYVRRLVGVDHVGLGPDFVDGMPLNYAAVNREIITRDMISDGEWLYVKGFEHIGELPNVGAAFRRRGWGEDEVRKVMGGNWMRVYRAVWGG
jgi:membrane dipeptidase